MVIEEETSRWWWFDGHKSSRPSPWLLSTLSELDAKTKTMLKVIEGDADSFAQRAETYYKKRPELISMVEDFYRAHRSLAERYDYVKSDAGAPSAKCLQEALQFVCDSQSQANPGSEEYAESDIEDPEQEFAASLCEESEEGEDPKKICEVTKLLQENEALRQELKQKDEEKREVIRQLALAMEMLKDDNSRLRKRLTEEPPMKKSVFERFMGKLFHVRCDGNNAM